jgi:hypothetical protein
LLNSGPLTPENNGKLHSLVNRHKELISLLNISSLQNTPPKNPNLQEESLLTETSYCQNCGAPNRNNKMNGKPWCLNCNRPLKITYKKPQTTWMPKFQSVTVKKAEIEAFKLKQKQFSL